MKYSHYRHKDAYEIGRLISYITAQCNSRKRLRMKDIMEFPWEREDYNITEEQHIHNQQEDVKRLTEFARMMQENLNNRQQ